MAIVLHDSGPFANMITETFIRIGEDGLYERSEDGNEVLLIPRPLVAGQSWTSGKNTLIFEGIEDLETFNITVSACLKITGTFQQTDINGETKEVRQTKYYERGKGLIYKSDTAGFNKILSEYAARQ